LSLMVFESAKSRFDDSYASLLKLEMLQSSIFCAIGKTDGGHGWCALYVSYTQVWLLNPFVNSLNCWFKLYLAQVLVCL
jgi:hypothetical protein